MREKKKERKIFMFYRYHEHQVIDDVPECQTIKEYKCKQVQKGYKSEQVKQKTFHSFEIFKVFISNYM
jgi:hypothetical protein